MNSPYHAPQAPLAASSAQQFSIRNGVAAFLAGSILVPASFFGAAWLFLGGRPNGTGNLVFWSVIFIAALVGTVIAARFSRLSVIAAAAVGVVTVAAVSMVGVGAFAAWEVVSGAV